MLDASSSFYFRQSPFRFLQEEKKMKSIQSDDDKSSFRGRAPEEDT